MCSLARASWLLGTARRAGAWWRIVGWFGLLASVGGSLVELFGEALAFGSCGVEVGFGSFGADAELP